MFDGNNIKTLRKILKDNKNIAVVGLSAKWHRPSYFAAKYMQENGYRIIPVNPAYSEVLGEKCYPSLEAVKERIDIVDCFRKSEDIDALVPMAISANAKVFWMQLGVQNKLAAKKITDAGMDCVQNRCVKIEHARIFGGLNWIGVNTKIISAKRLV
ncbi:MAG: CoA-binding protein [Proteobacteria bacterium]|nr:CoA-binding protein [Pseudomonadota bacterium]